jgi:cysteine synthase A
MLKDSQHIKGLIGKTPLIQMSEKIWAKFELANFTGSIKDRMINYIISDALAKGELRPGMTMVEATSGNTGISLAAHGAALGLSVEIIMPCNMSDERKKMMKIFGASITEVGPSDFASAIEMRNQKCRDSSYWSPMQFENDLNTFCHRLHTAHEIATQLPPCTSWSAFVSGTGTGGTLMGIADYISARRLETKIVQMIPDEPADSHGIQGVNDGANFLVDGLKVNHVMRVKTQDAITRSHRLAKETGLLVGISAAANLIASERYVAEHDPPGAVVTILCDRGERYMSAWDNC